MISIKDLHKSFHGKEVLRGISTEINTGDVLCIIGPSGSGKSTFLRCLNLLETPDSGSIQLDGVELTDRKTNIDQQRQKMGMVFQQFSGSPEMARELLKRGWYLGFDGPITYPNNRRAPEVVAVTPLDRIVVETDAPYLPPTPYRGKRNESRYLSYVIDQLAEWKGVSSQEMEDQTFQNGKRLFGLE